MKISQDTVVSIHYTLKADSGEVIDTSENEDPLVYVQGRKHLVQGLENALEGKEKGEKFTVIVPPELGYGPRHDEMTQTLPREEFENHGNLEVGMQFEVDSQEGPMVISISSISDSEVTVDANHPLAGENLNFEIEIIDLREITPEELEELDKA